MTARIIPFTPRLLEHRAKKHRVTEAQTRTIAKRDAEERERRALNLELDITAAFMRGEEPGSPRWRELNQKRRVLTEKLQRLENEGGAA